MGKAEGGAEIKFHIGLDGDSQDILCRELTENGKGDAEVA